jgi:hypothetical protein
VGRYLEMHNVLFVHAWGLFCIAFTCMSIGVAVFNTYYKSYTFPAGFAALSPNIS